MTSCEGAGHTADSPKQPRAAGPTERHSGANPQENEQMKLWKDQQPDSLGGQPPAIWVGFANGNTGPGLEALISMGVWQFAFGFIFPWSVNLYWWI